MAEVLPMRVLRERVKALTLPKRISEYSRHIYGLPKNTRAVHHDDVRGMWPTADHEQIDDEEMWGYLISAIGNGRPLPP